jgi:hypothetical protein
MNGLSRKKGQFFSVIWEIEPSLSFRIKGSIVAGWVLTSYFGSHWDIWRPTVSL